MIFDQSVVPKYAVYRPLNDGFFSFVFERNILRAENVNWFFHRRFNILLITK